MFINETKKPEYFQKLFEDDQLKKMKIGKKQIKTNSI